MKRKLLTGIVCTVSRYMYPNLSISPAALSSRVSSPSAGTSYVNGVYVVKGTSQREVFLAFILPKSTLLPISSLRS